MGFLSPLFLLTGLAVAVPIFLHLIHQVEGKRLVFPALRYLQRTERDHARRIRFRQFLLLFLRVIVLLLIVLAGARLFVGGQGNSHDPTALAIVLDNSLSSGRIAGRDRVLDQLKEIALESLASASPDDRIWVIRAGEPWDVARPLPPSGARARIEATDVSDGAGDLTSAVRRGAELVRAAGLTAAEVHLLSDLQATAFSGSALLPTLLAEVPIVVLSPAASDTDNRYLGSLEVGGGLTPLVGQRSHVAIYLATTDEARDTIPVRLVIHDRVRGAASAPLNSIAALSLPPLSAEPVSGWVEIDPDALRADDRRYFAFQARPAPRVTLEGEDSFFLSEALGVLEAAGRIQIGEGSAAEVMVSAGGGGLGERDYRFTVVLPPSDPALMSGLNRLLGRVGIPWRYQPPLVGGETTVTGSRFGVDLDGVRVFQAYPLSRVGDGAQPDGSSQVAASLSSGEVWAVLGEHPGGAYLLLGSALDVDATSLPVSARMLPFFEWLLSTWTAPSGAGAEQLAGEPISTSARVTHVETPQGIREAIDGAQQYRATSRAGVYRLFAGDSLLAEVALNPPPRESLLRRVDQDRLESLLGEDIITVSNTARWSRSIFRSRQGPEIWRLLLALALMLLLLEALVAAEGRARPTITHTHG